MDLQRILDSAPRCRGYSTECVGNSFNSFHYEVDLLRRYDAGRCEVTLRGDGVIRYEPVCRACYASRWQYVGAYVMANKNKFKYQGRSYTPGDKWSLDSLRSDPTDMDRTDKVGYADSFREVDRSSIGNREALEYVDQAISSIIGRYMMGRTPYNQSYYVEHDIVRELQYISGTLKMLKNS